MSSFNEIGYQSDIFNETANQIRLILFGAISVDWLAHGPSKKGGKILPGPISKLIE